MSTLFFVYVNIFGFINRIVDCIMGYGPIFQLSSRVFILFIQVHTCILFDVNDDDTSGNDSQYG